MTRLKFIAPALMLIFALSGVAVAATGSPKAGGSSSAQQSSPTPEQAAQFQKMHDEFMDKVMPLHNQLEGKYLELRALGGVNGVSKDDVSALVKDITALKSKLYEERVAFSRSLDKAGLSLCRGYHGNHDGMGMGGCMGPRADADPTPGGCMNGGMQGGMSGGMHGGMHGGMNGMPGGMQGGMGGSGPHHGDQ